MTLSEHRLRQMRRPLRFLTEDELFALDEIGGMSRFLHIQLGDTINDLHDLATSEIADRSIDEDLERAGLPSLEATSEWLKRAKVYLTSSEPEELPSDILLGLYNALTGQNLSEFEDAEITGPSRKEREVHRKAAPLDPGEEQ